MSSAPEPRPDDPGTPGTPGMSHPRARRRGRLLFAGVFVLGIVIIFLIVILVGKLL